MFPKLYSQTGYNCNYIYIYTLHIYSDQSYDWKVFITNIKVGTLITVILLHRLVYDNARPTGTRHGRWFVAGEESQDHQDSLLVT